MSNKQDNYYPKKTKHIHLQLGETIVNNFIIQINRNYLYEGEVNDMNMRRKVYQEYKRPGRSNTMIDKK